jgi:hypothetical protein
MEDSGILESGQVKSLAGLMSAGMLPSTLVIQGITILEKARIIQN